MISSKSKKQCTLEFKAAGDIRAAENFIKTALHGANQRIQQSIHWVSVWIYKQVLWGDFYGRAFEEDCGCL
jgi:hypothetical protein